MAVTHEVRLTTPHLKAVTVGRSWAVTHAWPAVRKFIVTKPLGAAGGAIILLMVLTAIFADVLTPYDPYTVDQRVQFTAPSVNHWFGTDEFGRDLFTRIVYGARVALFIGLTAAFLGATAGAFLGVVSLVGVIVSHIIVLFDFIEEKHSEGAPLVEALLLRESLTSAFERSALVATPSPPALSIASTFATSSGVPVTSTIAPPGN